jgi:hypothetical protein
MMAPLVRRQGRHEVFSIEIQGIDVMPSRFERLPGNHGKGMTQACLQRMSDDDQAFHA